MNSRDTALLNMRPEIPSAIVSTSMKEEECFQNKTIRPIAKLQNDLLVEVFKHYIKKHKNVFYDLPIERRLDYIETAIHKDMKFRNSIKGIMIGQFTIEEHKQYVLNSSALNKRIMCIIKDRLKGNLQLLEYHYAS